MPGLVFFNIIKYFERMRKLLLSPLGDSCQQNRFYGHLSVTALHVIMYPCKSLTYVHVCVFVCPQTYIVT